MLTGDMLRTFGLSQCPVEGCRKKPEGFKSKQALKFHLQSHPPHELAGVSLEAALAGGTGRALPPGPYHCNEPGCAFGPGKKTLKNVKTASQHAKTHAGAEAQVHTCERCSRGFALRYRLTEHRKTCGLKVFKCRCGLAMAHKSSLKTHIAQWQGSAANAHGEVEAEAAGGEEGGAEGGAEGGGGEMAIPAEDAAPLMALDAPPPAPLPHQGKLLPTLQEP